MKSSISVFTLLLLCTSLAFAKGTFSSVKGKVYLKKGAAAEKKARRGLTVEPGDTIRTEKTSFAKITMSDKNIFQIGPDSAVVFNQYDTEGEKKDSVLSVLYGRLRSSLENKYDEKKSRFRLNTKSAVLGVRGTDFLTSYSKVTGQSRVITFEGLVEVSGLNESGETMGTQELSPGQMTLVGIGQAPLPPLTLPTQQLQKIEQSTESEEGISMEEAANQQEASTPSALGNIEVREISSDAGTYSDIVDKKVVGDSQGQFVRIIVADDDDSA